MCLCIESLCRARLGVCNGSCDVMASYKTEIEVEELDFSF